MATPPILCFAWSYDPGMSLLPKYLRIMIPTVALIAFCVPVQFAAQSRRPGTVRNSTPHLYSGPDCSGEWPTLMVLSLLKNAGITNNDKIDAFKTKTVRIASEKIGKDLWRQVYDVTFTEHSGRKIEAIAVHEASREECSMSAVELYVVSQRLNDKALAERTAYQSSSLRQRFVYWSGCRPELINDPRGARLDGRKRTYLRAYRVDGKDTLFIVQYENENDHCGIVRDVIQAKRSANVFIWDCVDPEDPSAVVVGTWPSNRGHISGRSIEAWRVDLDKLEFVPIAARLEFTPVRRAGPDEGSDLAGDARKRAGR